MIENNYAKIWLQDEIVYFVYKNEFNIDLEAAKLIVADRIRCQGAKPYAVIADARGVKEVNKEARDYLAKEGSTLVKACAVIYNSAVHKMMGNFYLAINKPDVPTKLFTEVSEAAQWLSSYK